MSYFEDASLVYIPSAVKDAKTYSIKPTDGSGDLTFSRGSDIEATRVNANGYIEKAQVNLLLQSNTFSTTWATTNSTLTSGQTGYDGSSDAWKVDISAAAGKIQQSVSTSGVQAISVYAKAGSVNFMRISIDGGNGQYFNLSTGSLGTQLGTIIDANIESIGSGWYRCSVVANQAITAVPIYPAVADNDLTGTSGNIYLQDAQLNYGLVAQTYQETTTAAVVSGITDNMPRLNYDPANPTCPSLLLEPSRTNLLNQSEYIESGQGWGINQVSTENNYATSPEGVQNAVKITESATNSEHFIYKNIGVTNGVPYTFSVFAKADERSWIRLRIENSASGSGIANTFFDLSNGTKGTSGSGTAEIQDMNNGWYRCIVTGTTNTTSIILKAYTALGDYGGSYLGDGSGLLVYGAQLEEASYPTSYIPTYGSSATRTADACSKTGISSLIGQTEGTVFVEFEISNITSSANKTWVAIKDAAQNNRVLFYVLSTSPDTLRAQIKHGGTAINFNLGTFTANTTYKIAIGYKSSDSVIYLNGSSVATNTNALTFGTMDIFDFNDASAPFEGEVSQALLFTSRLSNADLATLTSL